MFALRSSAVRCSTFFPNSEQKNQKIITDDVLTSSKVASNQISLSNVEWYPNEVVESLQRIFSVELKNKSITIEVLIPDQPVKVMGDPHRFSQVMVNLLT